MYLSCFVLFCKCKLIQFFHELHSFKYFSFWINVLGSPKKLHCFIPVYPDSTRFYIPVYPDSKTYYIPVYPESTRYYIPVYQDSTRYNIPVYPDSTRTYIPVYPDRVTTTWLCFKGIIWKGSWAEPCRQKSWRIWKVSWKHVNFC